MSIFFISIVLFLLIPHFYDQKKKDSVIKNLNFQVGNFESIMLTKSDQLALSQELSKRLQNDLKKQKLKTKLMGGAGLVAVGAVIFILK